jgi:hypothetical protein
MTDEMGRNRCAQCGLELASETKRRRASYLVRLLAQEAEPQQVVFRQVRRPFFYYGATKPAINT